MLLGDFHIHSTFSDGRLSIPEIVDLYGTRGFGAIAITDHICEESSVLGVASHYLNLSVSRTDFDLYQYILKTEAKRAWDLYQMLLIPGFEITKNSISNHKSAHIIALGVTEYIPADLSVPHILKRIRDLGGFSIAAHPVNTGKNEKQTYYLWNNRHELADQIDAWEIASGRRLFPEIQSCPYAKVASSDLHHIRHFSSWKTRFDCVLEQGQIFDCIRKQNVSFEFYKEDLYDPSIHLPRSLASGS